MVKNLLPALLSVLGCALAMTARAQLGPELLQNHGFDEPAAEDGPPAAWAAHPERTHRHELADLGGNYVLSSKPGAYVMATQNVTLAKDREYTIRARFRTTGPGRAGLLLLHGTSAPRREFYLLWNQESDGQYVTAMRTFTAPENAGTLYAYDISKTGNVTYDWISLCPGRPDQAIINHFNLRQIDRAAEPPPVFHHLPTGTPLAGGPLKALFAIPSLRQLRETTELEQRLQLISDVIQADSRKPEAISFTGRQITERLPRNFYDVYIVATSLPDRLRHDVIKNVERGAGLLLIDRGERVKAWKELPPLVDLPDSHHLRQVVPLADNPEKDCLAAIQTGTCGEGRVVRLAFSQELTRIPAIIPQAADSRTAWTARQFDYWEDWLALIGEAARFAARGEHHLELAAACPDPRRLAVGAAGNQPPAAVRVILRSAREIRLDQPPLAPSARLRLAPVVLPLNQQGHASMEIPDALPPGPILADLAALNTQQEVIAWRSFRLDRPRAGVIASLTLDQPPEDQELGLGGVYAPDETVTPTVTIRTAAGQEGLAIQTRLLDPAGLVLAQNTAAVPVAGQEITMTLEPLPLTTAGTVFLRLEARLLLQNQEHDRQWTALTVPALARKTYDDFAVLPWRPGIIHPSIQVAFNGIMRELGQNVDFPGQGYALTENGMTAAGYIGSAFFRETRHFDDGIRPRCFNDRDVQAEIRERGALAGAKHRPFGYVGAGITDEAFLSSHHKATEFCFCPRCQDGFRAWLRKIYPTLADLNHQWSTSYTDWSEVLPTRTADIRQRQNFAPFVDFRTYMTDLWVAACRLITDAYHTTNPDTPVGHTNTFGVTPFSGNDYWKLATGTNFGWGQEYSEAIKGSAHKAIFEIWRSFTPPKFPNYGWLGYHHSEAAARYECWWLALHDAGGVSYFATNSFDTDRMVSWALLTADQATTPFGLAVRDALADLTGGVGKLLLEYQRDRAATAILWSHPSALVAWCESSADQPEPNERPGTDSYGSHFRAALDLRQHLHELQLGADYLADPQVLDGAGLAGRKLLLLPFAVAFPPELTSALYEFVNQGGVVLGDLRGLRTDTHGTPFAADLQPLARLFGVHRPAEAAIDYAPGNVTINRTLNGIGTAGAVIAAIGREQLVPAEANPAVPIATHDDGTPAIFVRPLGQGLTVYLNFRLPEYDVAMRALLAQITAAAGISSPAPVLVADPARPPRCFELNTFRHGAIAVHGFIRDFRRTSDTETASFKLPAPAYLYDVRRRQFLGRSDTAELTMAPGDATLVAALPYQVERLEVAARENTPGRLTVSATLAATEPTAPLGRHVLHCRITDPEGLCLPSWRLNLTAPDGLLKTTIPLGLNRKNGVWTILVRDVLTGLETTATLTLTAY
ncbi:MAG: beta-galactosidase [Lentisphaeria bacterium]|jgi:hypothetical protein|nr:beta-galactosidase [Lentisphaeria bacterium]